MSRSKVYANTYFLKSYLLVGTSQHFYFKTTSWQRKILEESFQIDPYIKKDRVEKLIRQTGFTKNRIFNWFKWRRGKIRKAICEAEQSKSKSYLHAYVA